MGILIDDLGDAHQTLRSSHRYDQQAASKGGWCCGRLSYRLLSVPTPNAQQVARPDAVSPGQRFNLRNASAMKGLKDHAVPAPWQERESVYYTPYGTPFTIPLRCCMCFELSDGVVWIASFQLLVYSILSIFLTNIVIVGVDKVGIDPVIFGVDSKIVAVGLLIFSLIVAIPMNIIGIVGAIQRSKNFVCAYRIYAIFMVVAGGAVLQETCTELSTNAQLGVIEGMCVGLVIQLYFYYVIRSLYLRISIENAGHGMPFSNYTQV